MLKFFVKVVIGLYLLNSSMDLVVTIPVVIVIGLNIYAVPS